jgi:tRNA (cytidine/uridine-2'-O-)-methyltransferase
MRIALYQPDIPQNTGTILRMAACLGLGADIIEPAGFTMTDKALRRAGMDYLEALDMIRHADFAHFLDRQKQIPGHLVLATTRAATSYTDYAFTPHDTILMGRESAGVPDHVHNAADACILIPMRPKMRSLNIAMSAAMIAGEALRQTNGFTPP